MEIRVLEVVKDKKVVTCKKCKGEYSTKLDTCPYCKERGFKKLMRIK